MEEKLVIRDVCVCGRRYRVRNPFAGFTFECPSCQRTIRVSEADIELAQPLLEDTPQFEETDSRPDHELQEAIPIDDDTLRPAAHGSGIGATGYGFYDNEDALVLSALTKQPQIRARDDDEDEPPPRPYVEAPRKQRSFLHDLLASFYLAGSRDNWVKVGALAFGSSLVITLGVVVPLMLGPFRTWILALVWLLMMMIVVICAAFQFFWNLLTLTIAGEDELTWSESEFDWWNDMIQPVGFVTLLTIACLLPMWTLGGYLPPDLPGREAILLALLASGFFFWPIGVLSVALGGSLTHLRPDWVLKCIGAIGPVYLVVWVLVMAGTAAIFPAALAGYTAVALGGQLSMLASIGVAVLGTVALYYVGYVTFRSLGLIYRHYGHNFPWRA